MREVQKMDSLSAWYGKLAAEEKKTMVRRGLAAVALAGAAAIFVIWNVSTGPGEAAPAKTKTQAAAPAETAAAPSASAVSVDGFRSAKFGDDEKAVRAAIEKDFGLKDEEIKAVENPVARTRVLTVRVKDLMPDSGLSQIGYVFGYKSKALAQVNVLWGTPVDKSATAASVGKTALALTGYFNSMGFDPKKTIRNRKLPNGAILTFHGTDDQGRVIELVYNERKVAAQKPMPGGGDAKGDEKSIHVLKLSYVQNPQNPDIFKVEKGAF
jgi:hypothetical protein